MGTTQVLAFVASGGAALLLPLDLQTLLAGSQHVMRWREGTTNDDVLCPPPTPLSIRYVLANTD